MRVPGVKIRNLDHVVPGVGSYNITKDIGSDKLKWSIQGRTFHSHHSNRESK